MNSSPSNTPVTSRSVTRRRVIRLSIAFFAALALVVCEVPQKARRMLVKRQDPLLGGCIPALFNSTELESIGREYLIRVPEEARRELLLATLLPEGAKSALPEAAASQPMQPNCVLLRSAIQARIAQDYSSGEVLSVAGWLLSRTELRLCALLTV